MTLRFAIWAAVSTREQAAADKFSIPSQVERSRAAGLEKGWRESAGPFIVPGESRTKYYNLSDAEREIQSLRQMLSAARNNQFDILIMTEFDRLRELLDPVFRTLAAYHIQLYSVSQPVDPISPTDYDQYTSDTVAMIIGLSSITSRMDISRLRRKWREQMPKRVTERGLNATSIPFGYRKPPGRETDRKAIPVQNPELILHVLKMRDLLLEGKSIRQIIDYLNENHVPPPRSSVWYPQTVRDILRNPFYAGIVQWGKSRVFLDPSGHRRRNRKIPADQVDRAAGKHQPAWDEVTHHLIITEIRRRAKSYRGRSNNQFTGLVKCKCGASMWRMENGPRTNRLIWRCSMDKTHPPILHSTMLEKVSSEILPSLRPFLQKQKTKDNVEDTLNLAQQAMNEIRKQQDRLETAYLAGQFELDRYALRKQELDDRLADVREELRRAEERATDRRAWIENMADLETFEGLPEWIKSGDQQKVNRRLHLLLEKIIVNGEQVEIVFKT
jgi:hypothetical protein